MNLRPPRNLRLILFGPSCADCRYFTNNRCRRPRGPAWPLTGLLAQTTPAQVTCDYIWTYPPTRQGDHAMIAMNLGTKHKPDYWNICTDQLTDGDLRGRRTIARRLKIGNLPDNTPARWQPTATRTPKAAVLLALDKAKAGEL